MALINTIAELQAYISVDVNLNTKSVLPYQENAKSQIVRLLGKTLYNALETWYNTTPRATNAAYAALLPYVQRPVANFAVNAGISALNVVIGPTGIGVVSTQAVAPASKDRTDALKRDIENAAWDAMEDLLEFLEENIADYTAWSDSEAYAEQYDLLIPSARKFDEILRINRSRLKYLDWRPTMKDIELLEITPQISAEMIAELKTQIKAGAIPSENNVILGFVQKALAYLTAEAEGENPDKSHWFKQYGTRYLMSAKAIMDANIANYPTYAASSVYDASITTYQRYENTDTSKFFVTG